MNILGRNVEKYTLESYLQKKPENKWVSTIQSGMGIAALQNEATVVEIDDRTIVSSRIGSFVLSFTHNPQQKSDLLYAGLYVMNPLTGSLGTPVSVNQVNMDLDSIEAFILDSIVALVETAEEDRAAGIRVPNTLLMGDGRALILKMGKT